MNIHSSKLFNTEQTLIQEFRTSLLLPIAEKKILTQTPDAQLHGFYRIKNEKMQRILLFFRYRYKGGQLVQTSFDLGTQKQFSPVAALKMSEEGEITRKKVGLLSIRRDLNESNSQMAQTAYQIEKQAFRTGIQKSLEICHQTPTGLCPIKISHPEAGECNVYKKATSLFQLQDKEVVMDPLLFLKGLSRQIEVLGFYHAQEKAHGDVKPENIVVQATKKTRESTSEKKEQFLERMKEVYFIDTTWQSANTLKNAIPCTPAYIPIEESNLMDDFAYESNPNILYMRDIKATILSWLFFVDKEIAQEWSCLNNANYYLKKNQYPDGEEILAEEVQEIQQLMKEQVADLTGKIQGQLRKSLAEMIPPDIAHYIIDVMRDDQVIHFHLNKASEMNAFFQHHLSSFEGTNPSNHLLQSLLEYYNSDQSMTMQTQTIQTQLTENLQSLFQTISIPTDPEANPSCRDSETSIGEIVLIQREENEWKAGIVVQKNVNRWLVFWIGRDNLLTYNDKCLPKYLKKITK